MIYLSHPIRGLTGNECSEAEMEANCKAAIKMGKRIRREYKLDLYVPAEHEHFIQLAFKAGYLTNKQILDIDLQIIEKYCTGVIFFNFQNEFSEGMLLEWEKAKELNLPCIVITKNTVKRLAEWDLVAAK